MPHKTIKGVPSVTEILSIIAKPELFRWYGAHGWDKCEKIKREAGEWGTELHSSISQYLKGEDVQVSSRCAPMLHNFCEWKERSRFEPVMIEPDKPFQSEMMGFHGTFDAVGTLDGELIVADWKTSSRIYNEYGLQLSAYAYLWEETHPKEKIRNGLIVRIDKKTHKIYTKSFYNLPMYFEVFKHLLEVYPFVKKTGVWKQ